VTVQGLFGGAVIVVSRVRSAGKKRRRESRVVEKGDFFRAWGDK